MPWNKDGTRKKSVFYKMKGHELPGIKQRFEKAGYKKGGSWKGFATAVKKDPMLVPKTFIQSIKKVGTDVYKKVKAKKGPY